MARNVQILYIAFLAVALCMAEAPGGRFARLEVRRNGFFLARQEAETADVTPYPSADDLKPEVPFEEAAVAEEEIPSQLDEVYGPPEVPIDTDDIVTVEEEAPTEYDEEPRIVENDEAENDIAAEEAQIAEEEAAAVLAAARLTARRGVSVRFGKLGNSASAKLRKVTVARVQLQPQQIVPQPLFYYVAQ